MRKIFISHPYADNPEKNQEKVDKICKHIMKVIPNVVLFSPLHMFSYMEDDEHREVVLEICRDMIELCDEFWSFGNSSGCIYETIWARLLNKPILEFKRCRVAETNNPKDALEHLFPKEDMMFLDFKIR